MSGDIGGLLIGGPLLISIAPMIIAGATAVGVTYGAVKIGSALGKQAIKYSQEKKRQKQLVVDECSNELKSTYRQMQNVLQKETDSFERHAQAMSREYDAVSKQLDAIRNEKVSAEKLDRAIAASRRQLQTEVSARSSEFHRELRRQGKEDMDLVLKSLDQSAQAKEDLVQWQQKTAAAQAMQRSAAQQMLRDAKASIRLLQNLASSSGDPTFLSQVASMERTCNRAEDLFANEMYQTAFANARTVIRRSAALASEQTQEQMERDFLVMEFRARLEGLAEEMQQRRTFTFRDRNQEDAGDIEEDLNAFSQGKYEEMQNFIQEQLRQLNSDSGLSSVEVQRRMDQLDREWEPQARQIMDRSMNVLAGYYERLQVLEVVAGFMEQQNYEMDWVMPVGEDLSQKLVLHFKQLTTGNTVSVTLDSDAAAGDIQKMAMEVLSFYGNDRPVTEAEKTALREHLTAALHEAGMAGSLECKGNVNQPSSQPDMNSRSKVRKSAVRNVI